MMKIGYARVSTKEQNEARQIAAFEEMGVDKFYLDKMSGKTSDRPQLKEMLSFVRAGDWIIVESISRLARNTRDLLHIVETINERGAAFVSLKESIDTNTPQGKFVLTVFAAMAELERENIRQRQQEGIEIAKANGRYTGRKRLPIDETAMLAECTKWRAGEQSATATMKKLGMKPNTFYRRVKEKGL